MTFLKKLGEILSIGLKIVTGVGPLIAPKVFDSSGKLVNALDQIQKIVIDVEVAGNATGLTGAQKLEMATNLAIQVYLSTSLLADRKVADETKFRNGVKAIVQGIVDTMNALKPEDIDTENKL